jgi:signal transduction histidine kinase
MSDESAIGESHHSPWRAETVSALIDALTEDDRERCATTMRAALANDASFAEWVATRQLPVDAEAGKLAHSLETAFSELPLDAGQSSRLRGALTLRLEVTRHRERFQQALDDAKLTALAEFAAGAGHEMNNPLAVISGRAQLLLRGEKDETRRADLALIKAQATRVHEMIADLMLFARPPLPKVDVEDVREVVRVAMEKLREAATVKEVQLLARLPVAMVSHDLDEALFGVAVRALVENAVNAVDVGGKVVVEVEGFARMVRITVRDNGPGIPAAERELIFDPYYSGRQAGRGLGMGLPKCWRIVQLHRGELTVGDAPGGGAEFVITFRAAL